MSQEEIQTGFIFTLDGKVITDNEGEQVLILHPPVVTVVLANDDSEVTQ